MTGVTGHTTGRLSGAHPFRYAAWCNRAPMAEHGSGGLKQADEKDVTGDVEVLPA